MKRIINRSRIKKALCFMLTFAMLLGFLPGFSGLFGTANAAGNLTSGFEGMDSDIFTALGFDTSVLPEGYTEDNSATPYGRDTVPMTVVSELLLAGTDSYSLYGHDNNSVNYTGAGATAFNGKSTEMPVDAQVLAGAVGDFTGDGRQGQIAYVGVSKADLSGFTEKKETVTRDNAGKPLYLFVADAYTGTYSAAIELGMISPAFTVPAAQYADGGSWQITQNYLWQNLLQVSCGDYDGDGTSEIAVYVAEAAGTDKTSINSRVDIYKYQRTSQSGEDDWLTIGNWSRVWSYAVGTASSGAVPNMVSLCSGDFNRDGVDDLGIAYGSATYTYTNHKNNCTSLYTAASRAAVLWGARSDMLQKSSALDLGQSNKDVGELIRVSLACGDVDSDGVKDLVATGQPIADVNTNNQRFLTTYLYDKDLGLVMNVYDTVKVVDGSYNTDAGTAKYVSANGFDDSYYSLPVMKTNSAVFTPATTGTSYTYVYVDSAMVKYQNQSFAMAYELDDTQYDTSSGTMPGRLTTTAGSSCYQYGYAEYNALSGNLNGDVYDVMSVSYMPGTSMPYRDSDGTQHGDAATKKQSYSVRVVGTGDGGLKGSAPGTSAGESYGDNTPVAVTMPDTDIDGVILEYTGYHYLTYSDPKVLAVIAAAPYFKDVDVISDYDYAWQNTTSYSQTNGSGSSQIITVSFSLGVYATFEGTYSYGKVEAEGEVGFTLDYEEEHSKTYEYTLSFETSQDQDAVAFYSIPTDNYVYTIRTARADGSGYDVSEKVVTRAFQPATQVLSLDYYESIQGNYDELPQVSGTAITSTPGDPSSYPASASRYDVIAQWKDDAAGVSFGNGSITQEISITKENSKSYVFGGLVEAKVGGGAHWENIAGDKSAGGTGGVHTSLNAAGGFANVSIEGATFSGTVTNMPEQFRDYGYYYSWKLFAYDYQFDDGTSVPVVSYLVGDVSEPPRLPEDFQQDYDRTTSDSNCLTWTYSGSAKTFYISKYYDFPVGGGTKQIAAISAGDPTHYTVKYDDNGKAYKEYYYIDKGDAVDGVEPGLTPYTEYQYTIQVERLSPVPPLSAPSGLLTARTKADSGYPLMHISESDNEDNGELLVYPDKTSYLTAAVTGPGGESLSAYYSTTQYQWQKRVRGAWTDLTGETGKTLTFASAGVDTAGEYRCRVNVIVKSNARAITAYTDSVVLTHSKRTAEISELAVNDAKSGGVEFYARVANCHSDSASIPSGTVAFLLTSNSTGQSYRYVFDLDATGTVSEIIEGELPEGVYTVYAYYSGSFIFKSASGTALYLSQTGSGYVIDTPAASVYGAGAELSFLSVTKTGGVTSSAAVAPAVKQLLAADAMSMGKPAGAAALPENKIVAAGTTYFFTAPDGTVYGFTATRSGAVKIDVEYAVYGEIDCEDYLTGTADAGVFAIAENTPAGAYVIKMLSAGAMPTAVYAAFEVTRKAVTLQLPSTKGSEGAAPTAPALGTLSVLSGGWADCDLTGTPAALKPEIADYNQAALTYTNTAGLAASSGTRLTCGYYNTAFTADAADKLASDISNYDIKFSGGSYTVLGATHSLYLGTRAFEGLSVGTVCIVSPDYQYTREPITSTTGGYTAESELSYQTGTRVIFTAVPDSGYEVYDWYINGVAQGKTTTSITHVMLNEDTRVEVQFAIKKNSLTFGPTGDEGGGTLTCSDTELTSGSVMLANSLLTFTATANEGYHFKEWRYTQLGAGTQYDSADSGDMDSKFDFIMPNASCSVYAVFERDFYTLTLTDTSGVDGLTAWYMYNGGNSSEKAVKTYITSGSSVKGDSVITVEPAKGCVLDENVAYRSVGSQGVADYTAGTYVFTLAEDTEVLCAAVRNSYDVTVNLHVTRTSAQPVDSTVSCTAGGEEQAFACNQGGTSSFTLENVSGGSAVSLEALYPSYYVMDGWRYDGASFQTAGTDVIKLAQPVTPGGEVKKGASYYYDDNGTTYYFTALDGGLAAWDGASVTITAQGDAYAIPALTKDSEFNVYLHEKPVKTVTLRPIASGSYGWTLPEGGYASAATDESGGALTVHEGDALEISVIPNNRYAVSYWQLNETGNATQYRYRATSLKYTFGSVTANYDFTPIFSSSTYNTVAWPTISSSKNYMTVVPQGGSLSSVATHGSFSFKLSGDALSMLEFVYANGSQFTAAGNKVGDTTYSYTGSGADRVYTITDITENQTLTLSFEDIGVTVNSEDVSAFSGTGWKYDPGPDTLTISRYGRIVSGTNNDLAPDFNIALGDSTGTVVFDGLTVSSAAATVVKSTRSIGSAVTSVGTNSITSTAADSIEVMKAVSGFTLRGGGVLNVNASTDDVSGTAKRVCGIAVGDTLTVTGGVSVTVCISHKNLNGNHPVGVRGSVIVGSADAAVDPTLRIIVTYTGDKTQQYGTRAGMGINGDACAVYSGSLLIDSSDYCLNQMMVIDNYGGVMDLTGHGAVKQTYTSDTGCNWRGRYANGFLLTYRAALTDGTTSIAKLLASYTQNIGTTSEPVRVCKLDATGDGYQGMQYLRLSPLDAAGGTMRVTVTDQNTNGETVTYYADLNLSSFTVKDNNWIYYCVQSGSTQLTRKSESDLYDSEGNPKASATSYLRLQYNGLHIEKQTINGGFSGIATGTGTASYAVSGTLHSSADNSQFLMRVSDNVKALTLNHFSGWAIQLDPKVPIYLIGDNYLATQSVSPLRITRDYNPTDTQKLYGPGTLTLSVGTQAAAAPTISCTSNNSYTDPMLALYNNAGLTLNSNSGVVGTEAGNYGIYTVKWFDTAGNELTGLYGHVWRQDAGNSAATASVQSTFNGDGSENYVRFYTASVDASASPKVFSYDKGAPASAVLSAQVWEPTSGGVSRTFGTMNDATSYVTITDANDTETRVAAANYTWTTDNLENTFALTADYANTLAVGSYTLRLFFHDDDPSDADYYTLDIPLTVTNTNTSVGALTITPETDKLGRGKSLSFSTAYTGVTPKTYVWTLTGRTDNKTSLVGNGSTAVLTLGADEKIGTDLKIQVSSYLGTDTTGTPAGTAWATISAVSGSADIVISCAGETAAADGSYTLALGAAGVTKTWDFDAAITCDGGATGTGEVWSVYGAVLRGTAIDADGKLSIPASEPGTNGMLRVTATYINADGSKSAKTADVHLTAPAAPAAQAATPNTTFSFDGVNAMKLMGTSSRMVYSLDGGGTWSACAVASTDLTGKTITEAKDILVKDMGDGYTTSASDAQTIDITRAAKPDAVKTDCTTAANNDGTLIGVTALMEWKKDGGTWADGRGTAITGRANGTYYVRVRAAGTVLASDPQTLTIAAYNSGDSGGTIVIVDGKEYAIGTETVTYTTTVTTVDEEKLRGYIGSAAEDSSAIVPITDNTTVIANLDAADVELLADKNMTLTLRSGKVSYDIPARVLDMDAARRALGADDNASVKFYVTITQMAARSVSIKNGTLLLPPVEFTVTASANGASYSFNEYDRFVPRTVEVTAAQAAELTTAVVIGDDGTERHVPTRVWQSGSHWYATINSLTNSVYALIANSMSFTDAEGKWYESAVNEMGSRRIVNGVGGGLFEGERSVTRAEFAAIIIRALGLASDGKCSFTDITGTEWYAGAVGKAAEYGIVNGYEDGSFRPNASITRQEAMAMVTKAAAVAGLDESLTDDLSAFGDTEKVASWALAYVRFNVKSGLIIGSNGELRPSENITRAEAATVVLRLLQKAELVDVRTTV